MRKIAHRIQSSRFARFFCASPRAGILENRIGLKKKRFGPFRGGNLGFQKWKLDKLTC